MAVSDPIADFITQIKNAGAAGKTAVVMPYSKATAAVADVLKQEGYLVRVDKQGRKVGKSIVVGIGYDDAQRPRVHDVKRISKPSRRVYVRVGDIRPVRQGYGTLVLSTSEGVLTGDEARKRGVGGEALFEIW